MSTQTLNESAPLIQHPSSSDPHNKHYDSQASSSSSQIFGISPTYLSSMFDPKDPEALRKVGGVPGLCKKLKVDPAVGLSASESLGPSDSASDQHHKDDPVKIGWVEGFAIMVAVAVVSFTNAINDYNKEQQFRKLNAKKEDRNVKVIRDGVEVEIGVAEINVGEILLIEPGDIMAVDALYIEGHNVVCDESSATGESDAIKKGTLEENKDSFILSGGKVMEGVGKVLVTAVGEHSFFGKIMMAMRETSTSTETPLQIKLDKLSNEIARYGVSAALILFMSLVLKLLYQSAMADVPPPFSEILSRIIAISIECITVIVVAVPEGLPMAVTIALAYATTQMIKDGNLVRQLAACETMGGATAVCTDKTGTLTQNRMTVVRACQGKSEMESYEEASVFIKSIPEIARNMIFEGSAINSAAFESADEHGRLEFIGSKSECALLEFIQRCGTDYRSLRADNKPLFVWPFSSEKKTMTTAIKFTNSENIEMCRVHVKGASEIVLAACTHYLDSNGTVVELTNPIRVEITRNIYRYAHKALRTFAIAYKEISIGETNEFDPDSAPLSNLTWVSLMGIQDPLRLTVGNSVADCHKAGVFVRMITGDNIETAEAIAKNAGILTKGGRSIAGPDWRKLTPEQQHQLLPRLQVMARSSPLDKQIVVRRLQERGEIVAMTGDGTNDAPALKMAEVGFSMGIAGTEVAKEASDIILMDDNFSSIVKALRWGRAVNDSVRKFLQFQLTVNITAVVLTFVSSLISSDGKPALTAVQLLWVNIIMDTLAALALATEGPTDALLDRKPIPKNASLITFEMWRMIFLEAAFQVFINLMLLNVGKTLFKLGSTEHDDLVLRTIIFNTFVFLQVFNELNCRRILPNEFNIFADILHDTGFLYVQVFVISLQYLIVTYGGLAFSTTPLTSTQWLGSVFIGSLSVPVGFVIRLLPDFGSCLGLESSNSSAQQFKPVISMAEMSTMQRAKDVKNVFGFFQRVRSSMKNKKQQAEGEDFAPSLIVQSQSDINPTSAPPLRMNEGGSKSFRIVSSQSKGAGWARVSAKLADINEAGSKSRE
ncbi:hypothetical protein BB559_003179 [Furculomyces boomerangus]|uniref:Calcium-transporting ATPase n=1 Tax=Furculomyces boomerangus TaxID=61424 RepID=A0A2T9YN91_9FUNG|nr:hypothetical protein BB559_003179 [Furculomyces boomerangus]